jgi:hypothetical protein
MKTGGCAKLSLRPRTGTWSRALNLRHWKTRLSTDHSRITRSRFSNASATAPLYRMLYLERLTVDWLIRARRASE